jgi:two-component system, NtrC family, sensor histidine kinase KinB
VDALRKAFVLMGDPFVSSVQKQEALRDAQAQLRGIEKLNMDAIVRKNAAAQASVKKATTYLAFAASFSFLILFSFIVNFPGFIADPLRKLSEGIREISRKNYKQRLEFKGNDEFSELATAFNEMSKRLNEWENSNVAKIMSEKLRIEAIIEHMQDAIIGLNEKDEILFFNTVAEQIFNLKRQDIIGKSAVEIMKKNDLLKSIIENKKTDKPIKIYADGKESYFQLESREVTVPSYNNEEDPTVITAGKPVGEVYILQNITRFKELDEAKTNFIATVSHELKTPISSIKMSLKLLNNERVGQMNKEQEELVQHIKEDSDRLLNITSELLDLAQAETGNLQLNFVETDPDQIVAYAIEALKFQAEQKEIKLDVISSENLPKVHADIEKTAWVLVNFLSNALRYSPEKSKVIVQVIEKDNFIEFSVRDFGKGIEEKYQKLLFNRYFQVPADGKNKSGSGLGLAISKDFIEAQHGQIFLESEIGSGSMFGFRLPLLS